MVSRGSGTGFGPRCARVHVDSGRPLSDCTPSGRASAAFCFVERDVTALRAAFGVKRRFAPPSGNKPHHVMPNIILNQIADIE